MKLLKITTNSKQKDIDLILENSTVTEIDRIVEVYSKFESVEYIDHEDNVGMICIIHDNYIDSLIGIYSHYKINFQIEDISKSALYGDKIETKFISSETGKSQSKKIKSLITKYYEMEITSDTILDKISERGIESLSKKDELILKRG